MKKNIIAAVALASIASVVSIAAHTAEVPSPSSNPKQAAAVSVEAPAVVKAAETKLVFEEPTVETIPAPVVEKKAVEEDVQAEEAPAGAPAVVVPVAGMPAEIAIPATPKTCEEDDPCWDCHVDGNKVCGPVREEPQYPVIPRPNDHIIVPEAPTQTELVEKPLPVVPSTENWILVSVLDTQKGMLKADAWANYKGTPQTRGEFEATYLGSSNVFPTDTVSVMGVVSTTLRVKLADGTLVPLYHLYKFQPPVLKKG